MVGYQVSNKKFEGIFDDPKNMQLYMRTESGKENSDLIEEDLDDTEFNDVEFLDDSDNE